MDPELPEAELVRRIAASSDAETAKTAEVALCRRFAPRIELYGLKHLRSRAAAEDLVQEVLLRTLQAIRDGRLENPELVASFVLGTCRNVTWDGRRAEQRAQKLELRACELAPEAPPQPATTADMLRMYRCLSALPEREATVIRMSFLEDRDTDEIVSRLNLSAGNVRVIRHRALAKLAGCLNPEGA